MTITGPKSLRRGALLRARSAALMTAVALTALIAVPSSEARTRRQPAVPQSTSRVVNPTGIPVTPGMAARPHRKSKVEVAGHQRRMMAQQARKPAVQPLASPNAQLLVSISIAKQRLTLFENGVPVATAPVSTGQPGHLTPMGIFTVIEKDRYHRSNIYSAAPMPYMQRITWSGVAMHEGVLPGYPASHGCIRMPGEFASRMWVTTKLGVRVVIWKDELIPVDFDDPKLFKLKPPAPVEAPVAEAKPVETPKPPIEIKPSPVTTQSIAPDTDAARADARADAHAEIAPNIQIIGAKIPAPAAMVDIAPETIGLRPSQDTATPEVKVAADRPMAPGRVASATDEVVPVASPAKTEEKPAAVPTVAPAPATPKPPAPVVAAKPLKPGPVSVFISRLTKRLYVRKGTEPLFDVPVTITQGDLAWGTHLFTAMEPKADGVSFRWQVISFPPEAPRQPKTAKAEVKTRKGGRVVSDAIDVRPAISPSDALSHIEIPQDAIDRIAELLGTGASLVISDKGLGDETGKYTDFIVTTR